MEEIYSTISTITNVKGTSLLKIQWLYFAPDRINIKAVIQHLFDHFCTTGYPAFLEDVSIAFVDKIDPSYLLLSQGYWRHILKTMFPFWFKNEKCLGLVCFQDTHFGI